MPSGHIFNRLRGSLSARPNRSAGFRPDIQGLRMLAVVAVILDHLLHWPSGGFVGVDVFFVISGFLITGILLRQHEKTGHISFAWFYKRRIKRIIPAATIVLAVTVAAGYGVFNQARATQTFWDGVWAFFFSANWHFAAAGTDYFQASGPVSPLQHFWSLSVEEQFYFVWPALMLGVLALAALRKGDLRRRTVTGAVMAVIVLGTFAWAMYESTTSPTVAYFSTFTRAWELGFGALIAIATPWWAKIADGLRPVLGWIGFLGILASYFVINDSMPFPAPWAALPVVATALVIVAGTGGQQRLMFPLTNPVSGYLGNISYSLYLWHFPVIILGTALIPDPLIANLIAVVLMLVLSVLSYHLIEVPIQNSPLLDRQKGRTRSFRAQARRDAWRQWVNKYKTTYAYGSLGAVVTLVLVLGGLTYLDFRPVAHADQPIVALPTETPTPGATPQYGPTVTQLQVEIVAALNETAWPTLEPTMDAAIAAPQVPDDVAPCGKLPVASVDNCTWGSGAKKVLLLGDSTSLAYTEAFRTLQESAGITVTTRAMFGCPFVNIPIASNAAGVAEACGGHNRDAISLAAEMHPDLVVITNTYEPRTNNDTKKTVAAEEWSVGMGDYVHELAPNVGKVVLLAPPPSSANVQKCYTPQSTPASCVTKVTDQWRSTSDVEKALAASVAGVYVDSRPLFCTNDMCPSYIGSTPVKIDLVHITSNYAKRVAPALLEQIRSAGATL